ncbi:hypothetical protein ACNI3Q_12440 [Sphingomonas sp. FW199]|uniref:hypothetical protein n=1 Tax=Sphingomonas sp. FW199 TaxID=3400217 RepID=UPI003CF17697
MRAIIPIALMLTTAGCATARDQAGAEQQAADVRPAATPTGDPVNCISTIRLRQSHVRSDRVIDFEMLGGKMYRNTLPNRCPLLGSERRFSYETRINQLCSVDIIRVLSVQAAGLQPLGACGLGQFQPVKLEGQSR